MKRHPYQLKLVSGILLILLGQLILNQCNPVKNLWLLRSGSVEDDTFQSTIDYQEQFGVIIVQPTIDGETYRFILDSGSPSLVITNELANTLNLDTLSYIEAGDTHGREKQLPLFKLDRIALGGIQFTDVTGFTATSMTSTFPFKCMDVDGIIGSNLMRHAVWQFDFQDSMLHLAHQQSKLPAPQPSYEFAMHTNTVKKPFLKTEELGDRDILLDIGSNGGLQLNRHEQSAMEQALDLDYLDSAKRIGWTSYGLYGNNVDTVQHHLADTFAMGGMEINPLKVRPNDDNIIGLKFLKDYRLTLNWHKERIGFTPYQKQQATKDFSGAGFTPMYDGKALIVSKINKPSPAYEAGLRYRDTILKIANKNGQNHFPETNCDIARDEQFKKMMKQQEGKNLSMVLKRNGLKDTVQINTSASN